MKGTHVESLDKKESEYFGLKMPYVLVRESYLAGSMDHWEA